MNEKLIELYLDGWLKLDAMCRVDADDSNEGDAIRDELDAVWKELSDEEVNVMTQFFLYFEEIWRQSGDLPKSGKELINRFNNDD